MKRIALLVGVLVLVAANTAEARRYRRSNQVTYRQPVAAPVTYAKPAIAPAESPAVEEAEDEIEEEGGESPASAAPVRTVSYSTATAQGVANIMAARNQVGHWGGNPGYEGCGCGPTPQAAYAICCYANSGMATVDVGYAQSASGMWYCCRRYR
ncbi:MAG: hypothetical protein SFU86_10740 [Pirellulaceae bacterium]|nr:hypothetical protein [Pirellulaceae bacterium]